MKVKELLQALEGVNPELDVVVSGGFDHSYQLTTGAAELTVGTFLKNENWKGRRARYYEYFSEEDLNLGEVTTRAFVVDVT